MYIVHCTLAIVQLVVLGAADIKAGAVRVLSGCFTVCVDEVSTTAVTVLDGRFGQTTLNVIDTDSVFCVFFVNYEIYGNYVNYDLLHPCSQHVIAYSVFLDDQLTVDDELLNTVI